MISTLIAKKIKKIEFNYHIGVIVGLLIKKIGTYLKMKQQTQGKPIKNNMILTDFKPNQKKKQKHSMFTFALSAVG